MSSVANSRTDGKDLVLGLGTTGMSVARYLKRTGRDARFADTRTEPPGVDELKALWPEAELDIGAVALPSGIGRVIASPGVIDRHPLLTEARAKGLPVVSDIELFAAEANAPFVGITGSNGKSTVTTLVARMADAAGRDALAGGNLGRPALDLLDEPVPNWYVLELSSFQLQRTLDLPAAVAVLLNISPDHLDWHADMAEYAEAKHRVFDQADAGVYNREDAESARRAARCGRVTSFSDDAPMPGHFGLVEGEGGLHLAAGATALMSVKDVALVGRHNLQNALAALATGSLMGLPFAPMLRVLRDFGGLPHRMQRVATIDGVDYVNDSKATNVGAAVASVESIDAPAVLIAGGVGKGGDFEALAKAIVSRLRGAVVIGEDAALIADAFGEATSVARAIDMHDAVAKAAAMAERGDTVLLAPACASFDQFRNYADRGDAFVHAVEELAS